MGKSVFTINCPKCGYQFELAETITSQLREQIREEERGQFKKQLKQLEKRQSELAKRETELEKQRQLMEKQIERELKKREKELREELKKEVSESLKTEVEEKDRQIARMRDEIRNFKKLELTLREKEEELKEKEEEIELEVKKRLLDEKDKVREEVLLKVKEEFQLRLREKEEQVESLRKTIDELKRKAESKSQQLQGEALEREIEDILKEKFPNDTIKPVPKGKAGADILQLVMTPAGVEAGTIIWEAKRTKRFNRDWLRKLRADARKVNAHVAVLVSTVLPEDIEHFDMVEGVWVCHWQYASALAGMLRQLILEVQKSQSALQNQTEKSARVYKYLTGVDFMNKMSGIVEPIRMMARELEAEKVAFNKIWQKRHQQIEAAMASVAQLYGDLEGIIGKALPEIKHLQLPVSQPNRLSD